MKASLIKYRVTIKYFAFTNGSSIDDYRSRDLYTQENIYNSYKKAKKEAKKFLKGLQRSEQEIQECFIEPVLLSESLI